MCSVHLDDWFAISSSKQLLSKWAKGRSIHVLSKEVWHAVVGSVRITSAAMRCWLGIWTLVETIIIGHWSNALFADHNMKLKRECGYIAAENMDTSRGNG